MPAKPAKPAVQSNTNAESIKSAVFRIFFIYIHNLKIYNLTKHIYTNDIIGSMIGMATLNDL